MAGEETHVGSGTFRINAKKALEALSRYQLPDAAMFVDLWLRCAEAGRAARIRVEGGQSGVGVRFDGRPFSAEELKDPFSSLFAEASPRQARLRNLALGVLAALRS